VCDGRGFMTAEGYFATAYGIDFLSSNLKLVEKSSIALVLNNLLDLEGTSRGFRQS
jgi:hypothetical protein